MSKREKCPRGEGWVKTYVLACEECLTLEKLYCTYIGSLSTPGPEASAGVSYRPEYVRIHY